VRFPVVLALVALPLLHCVYAQAQSTNSDFEAPADVRAFALALLSPHDNENLVGREGYVTFRLGRDKSGKVGVIPDALMLAMNDTGGPVPDFGSDPKILARVYTHSTLVDRPPSGSDDDFVKTGIPAFIIGANARDLWEIGRVEGIISIRLISISQLGPWEAFQSNPADYHYNAQHILEGRTADMAFADPKIVKLATSACVGDKIGISEALKTGADVNAKGEEGMSPLIWAVDCDNADGVKALLVAGADPNYVKTGTFYDEPVPPTRFIVGRYSALYAAVEKDNLPLVRLLLAHGGDPNTHKDDKAGNSALVLAWQNRNKDELDALLDADKDISRPIPYNESVAARAALARDFPTVEDLLKRGYSYDLREIGRLTQNFGGRSRRAATPTPEQQSARDRVIELLKQRGVAFPVLDDIRVMMTTNGLVVFWGNVPSWRGFTPTAARQAVAPDEPLYAEIIKVTGELKPGDMKAIDPNTPEKQN
jgi:hypothetical protein